MQEVLGSVKIIIILRDPVEKAFAQYMHLIREGRETLSFEETLRQEDFRDRRCWAKVWLYRKCSLYYENVAAYLQAFGLEHVKVILLEDLQADFSRVIREVYLFQGVDCYYKPSEKLQNRSGRIRSRLLARILNRDLRMKRILRHHIPERFRLKTRWLLRQLNTGKKPPLNEKTRKQLEEYFATDTGRLAELLGLKLPWKNYRTELTNMA